MNQPAHTHTAYTALATAVVGLDDESALSLRQTFETFAVQTDEWMGKALAIKVTSAEQTAEIKLARESRLGLRKIRVEVERLRKKLKEDSLRRGQAIDRVAGALKNMIEPIEEVLLEQEEFVERQTKARLDELRASRAKELRALGADPLVYADLALMPDGAWTDALAAAHAARDAREAKAKAEREAAAREAEERAAREKAQREENERLRREAAEAKAREDAERAAREREIAKLKADVERTQLAERLEREKAEAEARAEREKAAKAEAELARERRAREDAEARERLAAKEAQAVDVAAPTEPVPPMSEAPALLIVSAAELAEHPELPAEACAAIVALLRAEVPSVGVMTDGEYWTLRFRTEPF